MSVLLTSPAYLLAIPALASLRRNRLVAGALLAVILIATVDLMHFSQGWVQFGYRFSNDAAPFALVLVGLGFERIAVRRRYGMLLAMILIVLSLAINAWGVLWSRLLGW
jgi:general stress protein CsbA